MSESAESLLTLLALIVGAAVGTTLVILAIARHTLRKDHDE